MEGDLDAEDDHRVESHNDRSRRTTVEKAAFQPKVRSQSRGV